MRAIALMPLVLAGGIFAVGFQPQNTHVFDLKDPKGVTGMSIAIDAPLEPVRGFASGISGSLSINTTDPIKSTGKLVVDASTVFLGSKNMTEAMLQPWCLDATKYKTIEFAVTKVDAVKKLEEGSWEAKVTGNFTFHGVTKPLTVDTKIKHLPGKLKARGGSEKDGDLVQIWSKFSINRLDFEVAPDLSEDLIGNKIDIDLACTGVAYK